MVCVLYIVTTSLYDSYCRTCTFGNRLLVGKCDTLEDYCDGLATTSNQYNGYNLLLGDFRWAKHIHVRVYACVVCLYPRQDLIYNNS